MRYTITIQGKGGHSSRPDRAINPVECFASIFPAIGHFKPTVIQVDGGTAVNVIPDKLVFVMECICTAEELTQVVTPVCNIYHCSFEVTTSNA